MVRRAFVSLLEPDICDFLISTFVRRHQAKYLQKLKKLLVMQIQQEEPQTGILKNN